MQAVTKKLATGLIFCVLAVGGVGFALYADAKSSPSGPTADETPAQAPLPERNPTEVEKRNETEVVFGTGNGRYVWKACARGYADPRCRGGTNGWRLVGPAEGTPVSDGTAAGDRSRDIQVATGATAEQVAQRDAEMSQKSYAEEYCKNEYMFNGLCKAVVDAITTFFSLGTLFWAGASLLYILLMIAQVFLGFAMWWFDGAIYYTVILMGAYINNEAAYKSITLAWGVIRDLGNVLIIGGFVAVGIGTIIQASQYAADKLLVKLIIAALLINFSYFFAGAVIDATNYVTIQIYNSDLIQNNCNVKQTGVVQGFVSGIRAGIVGSDTDGSNTGICSLAGSMMGYTRMTSWDEINKMAYSSVNVTPGTSAAGKTRDSLYFNMMILTLMGLLFTALMAWVLIQAAFMLIVRFVGLIFLLITSPIGIAGIGVPFISEYASKWWSALFSQALFAPVYIFFFGLSLTIVKSFNEIFAPDAKDGSGRSYADSIAAMQGGGQGWFSAEIPLFISFFIAIASMFLAYMLAKRIADSTPELSGLYQAASGYANTTLRTPKNLFNLASMGLRAGVVDYDAKRTKEGTWSRFGFTSLSAGLRGLERLGSGKKNEKGVWDEASSEITDGGRGRIAEKNRKRMQGNFLGIGGLLKKDINKLTKEERDELEAYLAAQKPEELAARYGMDKVTEWAAKGLIDSKKLDEIRNSDAYTKSEKKKITDAFFGSFMRDANVKIGTDGKIESADWDKVAELWENMDETQQQILLAERGELKTNREFLSRLKKGDFDAAVKGMSKEDQGKAKTARSEGLSAALRGAKDGDSVGRITKRMSEDEIGGLDEDTALHVLRTGGLSASEKQALYNRTRSDKVKKELKDNHGDDINRGPGLGRPQNQKPPEEPQKPPQAASNQSSGLGGGSQADLKSGSTPGPNPGIIEDKPTGPLR
jgi:hypothetical protein